MINYYRALLRASSSVKTSFTNNPYIKTPTLILWGEKDTALVKELAEASYKYCPMGSKLIMIPNGSHWVPVEEPKLITKEILDFTKNSK